MDIDSVRETLVTKFAQMNPSEEFLIPTSDLLQNGMEILTAVHDHRINTVKLSGIDDHEWLVAKALEWNRWCKISNLKFKNNTYYFIATYSDGIQLARSAYITEPWYVKLSSVDTLQKTRQAVLELVEGITHHSPNCNCDPRSLNARTTESIMQIFGMGVQK